LVFNGPANSRMSQQQDSSILQNNGTFLAIFNVLRITVIFNSRFESKFSGFKAACFRAAFCATVSGSPSILLLFRFSSSRNSCARGCDFIARVLPYSMLHSPAHSARRRLLRRCSARAPRDVCTLSPAPHNDSRNSSVSSSANFPPRFRWFWNNTKSSSRMSFLRFTLMGFL